MGLAVTTEVGRARVRASLTTTEEEEGAEEKIRWRKEDDNAGGWAVGVIRAVVVRGRHALNMLTTKNMWKEEGTIVWRRGCGGTESDRKVNELQPKRRQKMKRLPQPTRNWETTEPDQNTRWTGEAASSRNYNAHRVPVGRYVRPNLNFDTYVREWNSQNSLLVILTPSFHRTQDLGFQTSTKFSKSLIEGGRLKMKIRICSNRPSSIRARLSPTNQYPPSGIKKIPRRLARLPVDFL